MNVAEFEELLKNAIGLDAASIGTTAVTRAVNERMTALRCGEAVYAERVRTSAEELQALVEAIVVPETWFFRDREAFVALMRWVREEWLPAESERTLRALSLPCSTGEEAYSIAMALFDAGLPAARFRVDAIDVSVEALRRAQEAIYRRNSFRNADLTFRDRYFSAVDGGWTLQESVRRQVSFFLGNVLDPLIGTGREPYDALFCRNLLIYFDRPTQDRAVATLSRLLAPKGLLFVGPSETALLLSHGFEAVRVPLAFALRRPVPRPPARETDAPVSRRRATPPPARPPSRRSIAPSKPSPVVPAKPAPVTATDPLEEIAQLANGGHFADAARRCEAYLRANRNSAKALYLLGMVRDASGKHGEAVELYRKALYLEPDHHDALMHLSYLLEEQGDATAAQALAARARRVAGRQKA